MGAVVFALAVLVWLAAAYALIRAALAWATVARLAPAGQKFPAVLALGMLNFPEAERIAGPEAASPVASYRRHAVLFAICIAAFFGLVLLNILSGSAA